MYIFKNNIKTFGLSTHSMTNFHYIDAKDIL